MATGNKGSRQLRDYSLLGPNAAVAVQRGLADTQMKMLAELKVLPEQIASDEF